MNTLEDKRIILTLDAGGTNFVFSAIQGNRDIVEPVQLDANAHDLDLCLATIVKGFEQVRDSLPEAPVAISFAFPGPADYPNGIIGDLGNLPAFRGGVALGPMLRDKFNLPVFINNDGDLFAYGEAIAGFLPYVNELLEKAGSPKRYKNLIGVTLGTGFGCGIVRDGNLHLGDNSVAAEIWLVRNKIHRDCICEESVSQRAITRHYAENAGLPHDPDWTPKDIYDIAMGTKPGDPQAAKESFKDMAEVLGDALANTLTLIDGLVVIGGGIAAAAPLFLPATVGEINGTIRKLDGSTVPRVVMKVFNLEDQADVNEFAKGGVRRVTVPGTSKEITYDPVQRTGIGISKLGASRAISIGAYAFALNQIT